MHNTTIRWKQVLRCLHLVNLFVVLFVWTTGLSVAFAAEGESDAGEEDADTYVHVIEARSDFSDPEVITREEARQIGAQEIDSAIPPKYRQPVLELKRALDDLDIYLKEQFNIMFTPEYTVIWQAGTNGGPNNQTMISNLDVPLVWTPTDQNGDWGNGSFGLLFRQRDEFLGTTPAQMATDIGMLTQTNDSGLDDDRNLTALLQLWWEQRFADEEWLVRFGRVDQGSYLDGNRYGGSDKQYFMAVPLASGSPNKRFPGEGFGFTIVNDPIDKPYYVAFGMHDANAIGTHSGFDTIDDGDYFFGSQLGFTPVVEGWGKGVYRVTGTYSMDNPTYGEAWSLMLSCDQDVDPQDLGLFMRYSVSDGNMLTLDQQLGTGVVFKNPFGYRDDEAGLGVFWFGVDDATQNDFGTEAFYRFQYSARIQFTPDVQFIWPENNRNFVTVFGLRLRTFF